MSVLFLISAYCCGQLNNTSQFHIHLLLLSQSKIMINTNSTTKDANGVSIPYSKEKM